MVEFQNVTSMDIDGWKVKVPENVESITWDGKYTIHWKPTVCENLVEVIKAGGLLSEEQRE